MLPRIGRRRGTRTSFIYALKTRIELQFDIERDINGAAREVQAAIRRGGRERQAENS
jgi:hypothetical protein